MRVKIKMGSKTIHHLLSGIIIKSIVSQMVPMGTLIVMVVSPVFDILSCK